MGNKCFGASKTEMIVEDDISAIRKRNQTKGMIAQKPTNTVEPPAPAKLIENFVPPPIIEIERKGSGRKQSIKSMSNLIHDEIQSSKNSVR